MCSHRKGTREQRAEEVAGIASRLFGTQVEPGSIISETLSSSIDRPAPSPEELTEALSAPPSYPEEYGQLVTHPLVAWVEATLGLQRDEQGRLERRPPITLSKAADSLSVQTGVGQERCAEHLRAVLMAGYRAEHPDTGLRLFAFRLHQFVSRGNTVYSSIEPPNKRYLALEGQVYVPGSRNRRLFPLAFCRQCGQEYFVVDRSLESDTLDPRELRDVAHRENRERRSGFLCLDHDEAWEPDETTLPEDWLEVSQSGMVRVKSSNRRSLPERCYALPDGRLVVLGKDGADGDDTVTAAWFVPAPFRFCLACGVSYTGRGDDFGRLATLSTEGRSTATTVLSLAIVQALQDVDGVDPEARKLLSFTDNRQDASLQAGHLNDFVQMALLRGALYAAVQEAGDGGLTQDVIAERVTAKLGLDFSEYSSNADAAFLIKRKIEQALRDVIGYRIYRDLRRGWRVNAPNLEQTGLLRVEYEALDELCEAEEVWRDRHRVLASVTPEQRRRACHVLLDTLRRELAIKVKYLDPTQQEAIKSNSYQYLRPPWAFEEDEELSEAPVFRVGTANGRARRPERTISATSRLGLFLRRASNWPNSLLTPLPAAELQAFADDLLGALLIGGQVEEVGGNGRPDQPKLYQLQAGAIRWVAGDGTPPEGDPLLQSRQTSGDVETNEFFRDLYSQVALGLHGMEAREHTAQVPSRLREEREDRFREGKLPVMYCSPTMELGVDIADLNAVNLRNVPPSPANYAQRSGRAGRSGQPALVLTYCSTFSAHDQYFFRRQDRMVAGAVLPPRLDLANEDLVRSHLQAIWLAETGLWLGSSLRDVLDLGRPEEGLPLQDGIREGIQSPHAQREATRRCQNLLREMEPDLEDATWYTAGCLRSVIEGAPAAFDRACERWRQLYLSARRQREAQHQIAIARSLPRITPNTTLKIAHAPTGTGRTAAVVALTVAKITRTATEKVIHLAADTSG